MTTEQFKARTKTVTRRFGWWFLNPGDVVCGVEKAMGLKKVEKIVKLGLIEIVTTRMEQLDTITRGDVIREDFPGCSPERFVNMLVAHYGCNPEATVNRIEFKYL